jgi:hypothetical protein
MKGTQVTTIQNEIVFGATLNAVIIYDKFDFAIKAKAMLERAAQRTDESFHWSVRPWRADILKLPIAAEVALVEAAEAHLILLAGQVQSLLPWLADWLERWAKCRQVQEAALAIWDGSNAKTCSARAAPELSQFAGRHGLSLIFEDNAPVEDKSSEFSRNLNTREVSLTPALRQIREEPGRDHYRHWGVNE